jgi:transcriptional regulator with XRE-family HTH domain
MSVRRGKRRRGWREVEEGEAGVRSPASPMRSSNPFAAEVGDRLQRRRLALRLSLREVGEALGISWQQVQKYESGLSEISAGRLYQLVQVLGVVGVAYFLDDARGEPPSRDECLQLFRAFIAVRNPNVRKIIIDLVVSLAAEFARSKE